MPRRVFTIGEVNRLIPKLERIFTDVLQIHASMRREEENLTRLGVKPSKEILAGEDETGSPAIQSAKAMFRAFYEMLIEALGQVADLGGEVKDLETGLVDFPARRGTDDIYLCWRLGEKQLGHWHPVDTGYGGRRPLDSLVPLDTPALD
jgi:hypothetical protein